MSSVILDYALFVVFLLGSTLYPLWGQFRRSKQSETKANYVFASGQVGVFAMMLSIARGTLGVRAFLGKCTHIFSIQMHVLFHLFIVLSMETYLESGSFDAIPSKCILHLSNFLSKSCISFKRCRKLKTSNGSSILFRGNHSSAKLAIKRIISSTDRTAMHTPHGIGIPEFLAILTLVLPLLIHLEKSLNRSKNVWATSFHARKGVKDNVDEITAGCPQ